MSITVHTIPMHPSWYEDLQATSYMDDAVVIGDRAYSVNVHTDGSAILYQRSVVIALHAHPNDVNRWHAKIGDVLDIIDAGPFQIVEEQVPGGRTQDVRPALVPIDVDGLAEEDEEPAWLGAIPLAISDDAIVKRGLRGLAVCGTCKRAWLDDLSTAVTPTPSGRCPFEEFHDEEDDWTDRQVAAVLALLDTDEAEDAIGHSMDDLARFLVEHGVHVGGAL